MQRLDSEGYLTNRAARLFMQAMARAIRPHGLASAYVPVLYALSEVPEMTQAQLTEFAGIEQPTMAATLGRMDRDGLLARRTDPEDGRKVLIGLNARGRDKVAAMMDAVLTINGRATAGFDEGERRLHRERMKTMIDNLEMLLADEQS